MSIIQATRAAGARGFRPGHGGRGCHFRQKNRRFFTSQTKHSLADDLVDHLCTSAPSAGPVGDRKNIFTEMLEDMVVKQINLNDLCFSAMTTDDDKV